MGCANSTAEIPIELAENKNAEALTVFNSKYVVPGPKNMMLHLKAKVFSFSGDTYKIKDSNNENQVMFQCQGKFLSFEHKRVICDADGTPVFVITEPLMQIDDKQVVHRVTPEGKPSEELFRVGSNFGNTAQYTQNLKNTKGHGITLNGKMSLLSMKGGIWLGPAGKGQAVAKVCSPVTYKDFLPDDFDTRDYIVEIPPGVDSALILAMVLAYEKMEQTYEY
eukprot:s4358_g2.t1